MLGVDSCRASTAVRSQSAHYDATEVMQGVTEVLAHGTAVFVEPVK